jgi:hypothetical protein
MNKEEFIKNLNEDEVIKKWDKLIDINSLINEIKNPRNCAIALEFCIHFLNNESIFIDSSKNEIDVDVIIFSVVLRIFKNIDRDLPVDYIVDNTKKIITEFRVAWKNKSKSFGALNIIDLEMMNIDIESLFVSVFADDYYLPPLPPAGKLYYINVN